MGQKTNPISNRIGITRGWDSNWVGGNYAEKIAEDYEIRKYLSSRLAKASLSKIVIERTLKLITVTIHAAKPGVIIGTSRLQYLEFFGKFYEDGGVAFAPALPSDKYSTVEKDVVSDDTEIA